LTEDDWTTDARALLSRMERYLDDAAARRGRVYPTGTHEEILARWPADFDAPVAFDAVVEQAFADSVAQHHPGYLGFQLSQPLPRAVLFEALASLLNNGMASFDSGPANSAAEVAVVRALCRWVGYAEGDGVLTSGGSLGNLTALLAARQIHGGEAVWTRGVSEPLAIAVPADSHYSVARAAGIMGLGTDAVVPVAVDARRRMRPDHLAVLQPEGRRLFAVVANAGSTQTGAFDPLETIADVCAERGLWLHVDGAHGASLLLSDRLRGRLAGIERADSLVWDAHKMMQLPALSTAVLFRRGEDAWRAFRQRAPYLYGDAAAKRYDLGQRTVECTKRGIGLVLYGVLRTLGAAALAEVVERQHDLCARFAERLEAEDDFEIACAPECNILCYRHVPRGAADLDAHQLEVRQKINGSGRFFIARTTLDGHTWLRSTISNPATTEDDLDALIAAIRGR